MITVSATTALRTFSVLERLFLAFPDFSEVLGVALNYPQALLRLPNFLALLLELLLIDQPFFRPGLLEFLELPLTPLEETGAFGVRLREAL